MQWCRIFYHTSLQVPSCFFTFFHFNPTTFPFLMFFIYLLGLTRDNILYGMPGFRNFLGDIPDSFKILDSISVKIPDSVWIPIPFGFLVDSWIPIGSSSPILISSEVSSDEGSRRLF